ncbi:MAG: NTP transferase domain-containing protein, partial [Cyanobacteria bacterium SZAS LIN-5]|nr:NTP transferase domain-containing protein [Cyanobacteria bacterium SZAS LIN-5]
MRTEYAEPAQKNPSIVGAILAAGGASRFGSPKQLAKFQSKSLLEHAIEALLVPEVKDRCIVLGSNFDVINAHLEDCGKADNRRFEVLFNAAWKDGLSTSIHTATNYAIACGASHLLLLTCDQPFVDKKLIERMTAALAVFEPTAKDSPEPGCDIRPLQEPIVAC